MHAKHWFFVINPVSGKGRGLDLWQEIELLLHENGITYRFAVSEFHKHTVQLVAEQFAAGARNFMGIGGDGTLNEMLNGIFQSEEINETNQCVLGLLPVGTGNDWVRGQKEKITPKNLIEKLKKHETAAYDVGVISSPSLAQNHLYLNVAGAGLDGRVVQEIEKLSAKGAKGKAVYLRGLLKALFAFVAPSTQISVDDTLVFSGKTLVVTSAKGQYFGGGMHISPNANPNNGTLDFTLVKKVPNWKIFPQLPKLFTGNLATVSFVQKHTGQSLKLETDAALPIQADGEFVGIVKQIEFSVLPNAIAVL